MSAATERTAVTITEPGVYDIPAEDYHTDPVPSGGSLSSSGARRLLPPSTPALFDYERRHPRTPTGAMEIGTAAHKLVLGDGPELVRIDADSWRTNAAKAAAEKARAAGAVPLLTEDYDRVHAMADALREHPLASQLLHPDSGKAEQSLFWHDTTRGVWLRARLDWLRPGNAARRTVVVDYKTTVSADPAAIAKSVATYGYHQQAAFYLDGVRALGLGDDPAFIFIFQEKQPPHLVHVVELDYQALRVGADLNRRAIDLFARCYADDHWPGHPDDITTISLPTWALYRSEEILT